MSKDKRKTTLIGSMHYLAMNNKNKKTTGGNKKMRNNLTVKVLSVVMMALVISFMFQSVVFAEEVKVKDTQELGLVSAKDFETKLTPVSIKGALGKGYVLDAKDFIGESRREKLEVIKEVNLPFNAEFSINEVTLDKDTKQFKADIKVEDELNSFNGLNFIISTETEGFVNIKDITYNIENKSNVITSRESESNKQHFRFLDTKNEYNKVNATVTFEYTNEYTNDKDATITLEQVEVLYLNEGKVSKNIYLPKDIINATRLEKYEPEKQQTIEIAVEKEVIKAEVTVLKEENIPNTLNGTEQVQGIFKQVGNNVEGAKVRNRLLDDGTEIISIDIIKEVDVIANGENLKLEEIVYDKTKKEFIPIYSPENNFEEAIKIDFEHGVDFLMVVDKYPDSINEIYCTFVETYDNTCMNFDGLKHDKSPFKEYGFIWMYLVEDFESGTRYDVLKERWGIDDNYIQYKLEPSDWFIGTTNQEHMDWSYTYFKTRTNNLETR